MKIKLARVRFQIESVECPDECPGCGVPVRESELVAVGAVEVNATIAFSAQADAFSEHAYGVRGDWKHGKRVPVLRAIKCRSCAAEIVSLPLKTVDTTKKKPGQDSILLHAQRELEAVESPEVAEG